MAKITDTDGMTYGPISVPGKKNMTDFLKESAEILDKMADKASKRPWSISEHSNDVRYVIQSPNGLIFTTIGDTPHKANAELTVKAVNSHNDLMARVVQLGNEFDEMKEWHLDICRDKHCTRKDDSECESCFEGDFKRRMKDRASMGCPKCGHRLKARTESGRDYIRCTNCNFIEREG